MSFIISLFGWVLLVSAAYLIITALIIVWNLLWNRLQNKKPFDTEAWFDTNIKSSIDEAFSWPGALLLVISIGLVFVTDKIGDFITKRLGLKSFLYRRLQRMGWYSDFDDIIQDEM